jgi:peptidoglycan/xylan/chitin deacetylase (PgdA/CDA1 family)
MAATGGAMATVRRLATSALRVRAVNAAARRIAAARGRSLALVYHRVVPDGSRPSSLVPGVPEPLFRQQVQALGELGEIVPPEELLGTGQRRRSRFALTFDDDYQTHADQVLPVLTALDIPGTFFLSGRSLHGLGPYWFEVLEWSIDTHGLHDVAGRLGIPAGSPMELALACERDSQRQRLLEQAAEQPPAHLRPDQIRALAAATMTVGFHTLRHRVLPALPDDALAQALTEGRRELATVTGRPLRLFAYPHGKADHRVAFQVQAAGYAAAWTGLPKATRSGEDRFLLGRWEPGPLGIDDFLVKVAVRLHRSLPPDGDAHA